MSDRATVSQRRVLLLGATGLIGREVLQAAVGREQVRLVGLARREAPLPKGARMEMLIAPSENWEEAIATIEPEAVICALGTTWKQAGRDEAAFRAVDQGLVVQCAWAAKRAGAQRFALVSSVGAASDGRTLYLRVKAEVEEAVARVGFKRLDVLRPALLRGPRQELRMLERLAMWGSPLVDPFLQGDKRRFRSIEARCVAEAALAAMIEKPMGRFVHEHDAIVRLARKWREG